MDNTSYLGVAHVTAPMRSPSSAVEKKRYIRFPEARFQRDAGGREGAKREALPCLVNRDQVVTPRSRYAVGRSVALRAYGQGQEARRSRVRGFWLPTPHPVAAEASRGRYRGFPLYRLHQVAGAGELALDVDGDLQRERGEGLPGFDQVRHNRATVPRWSSALLYRRRSDPESPRAINTAGFRLFRDDRSCEDECSWAIDAWQSSMETVYTVYTVFRRCARR